jgi:uncharacterized protein YjbI with pentapeptide repeats
MRLSIMPMTIRPDDPRPDVNSGDASGCEVQILRLPRGDRSLAGTMQQGRDFMSAELSRVDLTDANFYWAHFNDAVLEGAIMTRCDLRGAILNGANLRGADLTAANCGLDNLGGSTDFIKADLSGANLRNANLAGADLTDAILVGANLSGSRMVSLFPDRPTRLNGANLAKAQLSGGYFNGALYDARTVFPRGFNPKRAGMIAR